jgi:hypothetical protein
MAIQKIVALLVKKRSCSAKVASLGSTHDYVPVGETKRVPFEWHARFINKRF